MCFMRCKPLAFKEPLVCSKHSVFGWGGREEGESDVDMVLT